MTAPSKKSAAPSAGALIGGKYVLVEHIAEGGMGHLWRAIHRGLDREVALKLVHMEEPGAEERAARIVREAEICAAVRHRYVVEIYDADRTAEGQPFIVMELLRGETLAQRMARAPSMRVDELVRILGQCLSGLHAVHEAGVIHRDLKPDNIVLSEQREEGIVPKIVDFGISCRDDAVSSRERRLTRQGTVLGTPWYMPPEQARAEPLGPEADIYAMGVIAYEVLTGRLPFDSESLVALLLKITTEEALPLSHYRPDLPRALSSVVAKAMAHAPEDRFRTALELRDALDHAIDGAELAYTSIVPSDSVMVLPVEPCTTPTRGAVVARTQPVARRRRDGLRGTVARSLAGAGVIVACTAVLYERGTAEEGASEAVTHTKPAVSEMAAVATPPKPEQGRGLPSGEVAPAEPGALVATPAAASEEPPAEPRPAARRRREAPVAFRRLDF